MSYPSLSKVLLTQNGADNTAFTTAAIDTREYDTISYFVILTGGVAPAALTSVMNAYAEDGTTLIGGAGAVVSTGAASYSGGWGPGCTGSANLPSGGYAQTVPPFVKVTVPAFGLGITAKLTIYGRRGHRGPDVSLNAD